MEPERTRGSVVFLGTSEFAAAVLARLAASATHRPALVVTRPDRPRGRGRKLASPPVALRARALELPLEQPARINDPAARALLDGELAPGLVLSAHAHAQRALDLDVHARQAQAPLLADLGLLAAPLERGVDQRRDGVVGKRFVHQHPVQDPELGRREAHAERVVHELGHALDLLRERLVEAIHR